MILGVLAAARPTLGSGIVVSVHLRDYAGLQKEAVRKAKADVTAIFKGADMEIVWIDPSQVEARPSGGGLFTVIVLPRAPAQSHLAAQALGFTWLTPTPGHITYVIDSRIDEMARRFRIDKGVLLAAVIAHEMGHLFLRDVPHARRGIMRAKWELPDFQLAAQGGLLFLPHEERMLRAAAHVRAAH
jgi:hypothetical protein